MEKKSIIDSFRQLPPSEKIRLVQELWEQVADEAARLPLTDQQRRLLDERIREHEENPGDVEAWDKARADVLRGL